MQSLVAVFFFKWGFDRVWRLNPSFFPLTEATLPEAINTVTLNNTGLRVLLKLDLCLQLFVSSLLLTLTVGTSGLITWLTKEPTAETNSTIKILLTFVHLVKCFSADTASIILMLEKKSMNMGHWETSGWNKQLKHTTLYFVLFEKICRHKLL